MRLDFKFYRTVLSQQKHHDAIRPYSFQCNFFNLDFQIPCKTFLFVFIPKCIAKSSFDTLCIRDKNNMPKSGVFFFPKNFQFSNQIQNFGQVPPLKILLLMKGLINFFRVFFKMRHNLSFCLTVLSRQEIYDA